MAKESSISPEDDAERKLFDSLKPFIEKVQTSKIEKGENFQLCLRSSLVKCYEFNLLARRQEEKELAFFWSPTLRGICEDLIVLNFIQGLPESEREEVIGYLMWHDIYTRVENQAAFFSVARPQQPVLHCKDVDKKLTEIENRIRLIWNAHGWPGMKKKVMPQIRELAAKQDTKVLSLLYEYLYRLTSGTVHFSVPSLLRLGWGATPDSTTFSTKNLDLYFSMFSQVYGSFLFCLYFEFFDHFLRPDQDVKTVVDGIRKALRLRPLWPEMVTFEDMNVPRPEYSALDVLHFILQSENAKGLIK